MQEVKTTGIHAAIWNLDELAGIWNQPRHESNAHSDSGKISGYDNDSSWWYGGIRSNAEAEALLRNGWKDGATRLQGLIGDLTPPQAKSRRRKPTWSDQGDELSIDRAMIGQWDSAWRTSKRVWTSGPSTVTLVTKWGGNEHQDAAELFWQGASAAVIADALEESGYRVKVVCGTPLYSSATGADGAMLVTLKEESEPMRLDSLASLMCHAGIFRTYGFKAIEALPFNTCSTSARDWTATGHGSTSYRDRIRDAGIWPDDATTLGEVTSRASCVAEIERVLQSFA